MSSPAPPASHSLLTRPVLLVIVNYGWISLLDIAHFALLPLFFAIPVASGGLGQTPRTIGLIMGAYGFFDGVVQAIFFPILHRWLGAKSVFLWGIVGIFVMFAAYPIMHSLAALSGGKMTPGVWIFLIIQLISSIVMDFCFGPCVLISRFLRFFRFLFSDI